LTRRINKLFVIKWVSAETISTHIVPTVNRS